MLASDSPDESNNRQEIPASELPINDSGHGEGLTLLPQHVADLAKSNVPPEFAIEHGIYSETDRPTLGKLAKWKGPAPNKLGAGLVFPIAPDFVQIKFDNPQKDKSGKIRKYVSPTGSPSRAYIPEETRKALADPSAAIVISEGVKKILAMLREGIAGIALIGVSNWQVKRARGITGKAHGERKLIPDLGEIAWKNRPVAIAFDSDAISNPNILWAEWHLGVALQKAGAKVKIVRIPPAADGSKQGIDDYIVAHGAGAFRELLTKATTPVAPNKKAKEPARDDPGDDQSDGGSSPENATNPGKNPSGDGGDEGDDEKPRQSAADILAAIGHEFELWHDADGRGYATVGRKTFPIRSKEFKLALSGEFRKRLSGKVPNSEAMAAALNVIEGTAILDGPEGTIGIRLARHADKIYLHLADVNNTVIEIDAAGWRACESPPVRFRKPAGMLPLPMPVHGGSVSELRNFLNLPDDDNFSLAIGFLCIALNPEGPFPALVLSGEQGSAKSTTSQVFKELIDPAKAARRGSPKEIRDLMIAARNGWLITYDNLNTLPTWLSDTLCRLSTGGGFGTRTLYADDDETLFDAQRPAILNGIVDFVEAPDLLERSIILRHPPIAQGKRKREKRFWKDFFAARPRILGALLQRISGGLRAEAQGHGDEPDLPRMADAAAWAHACEVGAGESPRFLAAYRVNQESAHEVALDASPVAAVVVQFMGTRTSWAGTPSELLDALTDLIGEKKAKARDWPKASNALTNALKKITPDLRRARGIFVESTRTKSTRSVSITKTDTAPDSHGKQSSPSSPGDASASQHGTYRVTVEQDSDRHPSSPSSPGTAGKNASVSGESDPVKVGDDAGDDQCAHSSSPEKAVNHGKNRSGDDVDEGDGVFPGLSGATTPKPKRKYRPNQNRGVPDLDKEGGAA